MPDGAKSLLVLYVKQSFLTGLRKHKQYWNQPGVAPHKEKDICLIYLGATPDSTQGILSVYFPRVYSGWWSGF